jgi:hypothetical protein
VPATALVSSDQGTQIAVLGAGNKVVLKSVQLGRYFGDSVEVTAGLLPTDQVIDSPPETLQAGDATLPQQLSLKCTSGSPGRGIASCRSAIAVVVGKRCLRLRCRRAPTRQCAPFPSS